MRKTLFAVLFTLAFCHVCPLVANVTGNAEIRAAAFVHSSHLFRRIYGNVNADFEVEAAIDIYAPLQLWGNCSWFSRHGRSLGLHTSTRVCLTNGSLGIKYLHALSKDWVAYLGIGSSFADVYLKNEYRYDCEKSHKLAVGAIFKGGVQYYFYRNVFLDVFVDYLYQPADYRHTVDVGGVKPGAGLGFQF